ncbi:hypothetical protein ABEB36_008516 [Hypothenemus hampei]|uniref:Uncharacterized protein n=1 Tax=Hypothenemus hampei TaxID=57062 RepID=A0ABD1EM95_HYPHA
MRLVRSQNVTIRREDVDNSGAAEAATSARGAHCIVPLIYDSGGTQCSDGAHEKRKGHYMWLKLAKDHNVSRGKDRNFMEQLKT